MLSTAGGNWDDITQAAPGVIPQLFASTSISETVKIAKVLIESFNQPSMSFNYSKCSVFCRKSSDINI